MITKFVTQNGKKPVIQLDLDYLPPKGATVTLPVIGSGKVRKLYRVMDINVDYRIVADEPQIVLGTATISVE